MNILKKKKTVEDKFSINNRGESLTQEIKLNNFNDQWDEMKQIYSENISSVTLEKKLIEREKEAVIERKKVFDEVNKQKIIKENDEYNRIIEIENKIKNKKKREIKKRDIAFRNRSVLG